MFKRSLVPALVVLAIVLLAAFAEAGQDTMRNCPPQDRWAISVWGGPTGVYTGEAMATCGGVQAVYSLDPETQEWRRWFPERPELSNIDTLDALQGMFVLGSVGAPTETLTATPTPSSEKTATVAPTPTESPTPVVTAIPVTTPTVSPLPTASPSSTPLLSVTPTAVPTPTQTTTPGPTLQFFHGDGDGSVGPFPLWQGWATFSFTYEGVFYVGLYDPAGDQIEWFRGGEKRVMIPATAAYTMEVEAQRPWTITVRQ